MKEFLTAFFILLVLLLIVVAILGWPLWIAFLAAAIILAIFLFLVFGRSGGG